MSIPSRALGTAREGGESHIPQQLLHLPQWVAWWSVIGKGQPTKLPNGRSTQVLRVQAKPHKLPINPRTGGLAATTRRSTWCSFEGAQAASNKWDLSGIGFVFTNDDPFSGVDIDNCRDPKTGQISDWAWLTIRTLNSYTELSPSGTGVHIIVIGKLSAGQGNQVTRNDGKIEMFSRARYFTFTGHHIPGTPTEVFDRHSELTTLHGELFATRKATVQMPSGLCAGNDQELLTRAMTGRNGRRFTTLWRGLWQEEYASQSEADFALCRVLANVAGGNAKRIDSLFRQSGLMRDKWNRDSYRQTTIQRAVQGRGVTRGRQAALKHDKALGLLPERSISEDENDNAPDLVNLPHTDTGNAERLVRLYGAEIKFCPEMHKWFVWDGCRWALTDSRHVRRLLKKTLRQLYQQAADLETKESREAAETHARRSESARAIRAALECAECEDLLIASASSFDKSGYSLNCTNGTLDLHTGELRAHDRKEFLTKLVHLNYRADAECPLFLRFLHEIMDEPQTTRTEAIQGLVGYLQKCFGYALTSDVSEKVVFCLYGSGSNGKTTLLEVVRFILREYSAQLLSDTLTAHKSRESNTSGADLADLHGVRFVTTSEAEEGQRLAVGKLKYLTQGMGEVKACRKYENPITFRATHKLFLDTNHKPVIRGSETAVWTRLRLVPFRITIPISKIDKALLDKLKGEAEGILAWMVAGCRRWMNEGLGDCPEIDAASAQWRKESDHFPSFIDEICRLDPEAWVSVSDLWAAYCSWCHSGKEDSLPKNVFYERLENNGCRGGRRLEGTVRAWIGIALQHPRPRIDAGDKVTRIDTES